MSAPDRRGPLPLVATFVVAILASAALVSAASAANVMTTYDYDAAGHLTSVAEACDTTGYTYCVGSDSCCALQSDLNNCGSCGHVCPSVPSNGYATCSSGTCSGTCNAGYTYCSPYCTNTSTDPANCGSCGHVCPGNYNCNNGVCVNPCYPLRDCCGDGLYCRSSCSPQLCQ